MDSSGVGVGFLDKMGEGKIKFVLVSFSTLFSPVGVVVVIKLSRIPFTEPAYTCQLCGRVSFWVTNRVFCSAPAAERLVSKTWIFARFRPSESSMGILNSPLFSLLPIAEVEFVTITICASPSTVPKNSILPDAKTCESLGFLTNSAFWLGLICSIEVCFFCSVWGLGCLCHSHQIVKTRKERTARKRKILRAVLKAPNPKAAIFFLD